LFPTSLLFFFFFSYIPVVASRVYIRMYVSICLCAIYIYLEVIIRIYCITIVEKQNYVQPLQYGPLSLPPVKEKGEHCIYRVTFFD